MCRAAQTPPHVPGPLGQVLLQRFSQVPQNAGEPAANVGSIDKAATVKIIVNTEKPTLMKRMESSFEALSQFQPCWRKAKLKLA